LPKPGFAQGAMRGCPVAITELDAPAHFGLF
jgi:hypothetical protein